MNPPNAPATVRPSRSRWPPLAGWLRPLLRQGQRQGVEMAAWLWPRACLLCEQACGSAPLCPPCHAALPGWQRRRCHVCAAPLQRSRPVSEAGATGPGQRDPACRDCASLQPWFTATLTAADYAPPLAEAIIALKFGGQLALAAGLGQLLAQRLGADRAKRQTPPQTPPLATPAALDCLVPIPLAAARLAERGFNQAEAIARSLALHWPLAEPPPLRPTLLTRLRETAPQSGLAGAARHRNVAAGFAADPAAAGLVIGVVDDVMTTGATLDAAARALIAVGALAVVGLVVARTP